MFIRGAIGTRSKTVREADMSEDMRAIRENWVKTGKMTYYNFMKEGWPIIGPAFQGKTEADGLSLELYAFPSLALFEEWVRSEDHIAQHSKLMRLMQQSRDAGDTPGSMYHFHATDERGADVKKTRAQLREIYRWVESTEWAKMPEGAVQKMMLGDHD